MNIKLNVLTLLCFSLTACQEATPVSISEDERVGSLPTTIIEPANNEVNAQKIELGRMLFWDPVLSGNQDVACVSCHHPDNAYAENIDLSIGVGGQGLSTSRSGGTLVKRNAPTIINTAFNGIDSMGVYDPLNTALFWDNRASSLEEQALGPIKSEEEMKGTLYSEDEILDVVSTRLRNIDEYVSMFDAAFGDTTIDEERIAMALAAFQRTLISNNSAFDRYARGDDSALTQQQVRGLNAFIDSGCSACHSGPMFSDFELHQLPVDSNSKLVAEGIIDQGVDGQFRTPSLRNVALTAPYMHNGTVNTLSEAIAFYDDIDNPGGDPHLSSLEFDDADDETIAAIEAFLHSLTDDGFDKTIPETVLSGLTPGGDI
ncbi:cytochrome C peroxidase [Vibrio sp.]|nr:cytochrome C peroxidase [Vibrio sp.]